MLKNIASNWAITLVTIVVTLVVTRFVIFTLGEAQYGIWLVIAALTSYLQLMRGGLPAATVRYLSEAVGSKVRERFDEAVSSALYLYGVLSGVAFLAGLGLFAFFVHAYEVPETFPNESRIAFAIVMTNVALGFVSHLPLAIMESHDDFVRRNVVRLVALIGFRLGGTLLLLSLKPSIVMLAVVLCAMTLTEIVVGATIAVRRFRARVTLRHRSGAMVKKMFRYSAYVLLLAAGYRLAFQSDALVIGAFGDLADVAVYSVANSLLLYLSEFIEGIGIVVMPRATKLAEQGRRDELADLFLTYSKTSLSLALLVGGYLFFMGPAFIAWWLTPEIGAEAALPMRILTASFLVLLPVTGAGVRILMGVGNVAVPALAWLAMGVVNVALSIALVPLYGSVGAAIGTAGPNVLFAAVVTVLSCREAGASLGRYVTYVFGRALVAFLPLAAGLAAAVWYLDAHGVVGLALTGAIYVALFAALWLGWVYRDDPLVDWRESRIGQLWNRLR